ncbi:hypothetical protein GX50_02626 [[Emmonsia] crescens]|uniref:Uncharacterized protein n=1 Tax=[Emmonsia] crescens TaxID=73230 RepID=A0A2B7ZMZ5_9EURO|nr:hypothetical protein GX50_02626 [Emmonsia crescens]
MPHLPSILPSISSNRLPLPTPLSPRLRLAFHISFDAGHHTDCFDVWFLLLNDLVVPRRNNTADIQCQSQCKYGFLLHLLEHGNGHSSKHERDVDGDVKMIDTFDRRDKNNSSSSSSNNNTLERALDEILHEI